MIHEYTILILDIQLFSYTLRPLPFSLYPTLNNPLNFMPFVCFRMILDALKLIASLLTTIQLLQDEISSVQIKRSLSRAQSLNAKFYYRLHSFHKEVE